MVVAMTEESEQEDHHMTKEGWARFETVWQLVDGDLKAVREDRVGECRNMKTFRCSCGENFIKPETAKSHLEEVR